MLEQDFFWGWGWYVVGRTCWYLGQWDRAACQGPEGAASASPAQSRCRGGETLCKAAENLVLPEQALLWGTLKNYSQHDLLGWAGQQGSM